MKPTIKIPWSDIIKYAIYQIEKTKSFPNIKPTTIKYMRSSSGYEPDREIVEKPDYIEIEIETDVPYIKP